MQTLVQDIRYALRQLRKAPGFTLTVVMTLALGLGATTAMLAIVDAVLVRPLNYPHPERLVVVGTQFQDGMEFTDWAAFQEMQRSLKSFASLAGENGLPSPVDTPDGSLMVNASTVTPNLFQTIGVKPAMGRWPIAADQQSDGGAVVVSDGFWREHLHANKNVLGSKLKVSGHLYNIVGVMPEGFGFPPTLKSTIWTTLQIGREKKSEQGFSGMQLIGRLRDGVSLDVARAEGNALMPHLPGLQDVPSSHPRFEVIPYLSFRTADQRPALLALLGGTFLLLLISVVNAANLQIARATGRQSEMAVRSALGAGGNRLLRMLLTESVLLSLAGGFVGLLLAESALSFTRHHYGTFVPRLNESRIDLPAFLACVALTLLCGVVAGLMPGLRVFRVPPADALQRRGTESQRGGHRARLSHLLVVTEIALTCVLLTSCGVLLRSFATLMGTPLGFDPQHAYSFIIYPKNPGAPVAQSVAADTAVLERLAHVPGVTSAGIATTVPYSNFRMEFDSTARIAGESVPDKKNMPQVSLLAVSPGYFSALQIPLTAGRGLTDADRDGQPLVAVANEAFVRNVLHNQSAIGKQVILEKVTGFVTPIEIVGVSADVGRHGSDCCAELAISYQQIPLGAMTSRMLLGINSSFAVRTAGDVPLAATVREIVRTAAPDFALDEVVSLQTAENDSLKNRRVALTLASVLGGIALLLGAAGVYGLLAYLFGMRVREIGIRMALGAQRSQVLQGVLSLAAKLAIAGTVAGIALSMYAGRFLKSMLFGVKALDPVTFIFVFGVLMVVAVVAAVIPARRAASIDPIQALRSE